MLLENVLPLRMMRTSHELDKKLHARSPTSTQVRVLLGLQDLYDFKTTSRMHTESDFDVLYMDGKITKRSSQRYQSHLQIPSGSSGIAETSQSPETGFRAT